MTPATKYGSEESEFTRWARSELDRAGMFDEDSDYNGELGRCVMALVYKMSEYGHSGTLAIMAGQLFYHLVMGKRLGPLTDHPDEWMTITLSENEKVKTWQSRRQGNCFSNDGGKTYYCLDEPMKRWARGVDWLWRKLGLRPGWRFQPRHKTKHVDWEKDYA